MTWDPNESPYGWEKRRDDELDKEPPKALTPDQIEILELVANEKDEANRREWASFVLEMAKAFTPQPLCIRMKARRPYKIPRDIMAGLKKIERLERK